MIFLSLFFEFLKIGLFSVGGGLATIPFLYVLGAKTNWFSSAELVNMIALSETTPGPLGVNMATFTGFQTAGVLGGAVATLGLALPALVVIIAIYYFLDKFKESNLVQSVFRGLRPAVAGMILFFVFQMLALVFKTGELFCQKVILGILFLCYSVLIYYFKWHPIFFILLAAVIGILFKF